RYRVLFEQSPYGILLVDLETGKTIEANDIASKQLGYTHEEFAALRISDYEALEKPEETARHMQKIMQEGSDNFETLQRTKSGEIRNVHIWVKTLALGDRGLFYGIFQDITEHKRAEETLRQRLTELEALHTVSTALRTSQTSDEALPLLLDQTLAALETDTGAIWLYDPEADELCIAVARGWYSDLSARTLKPGEGIAGKVFSTGQIYLFPDFSLDPQARPPRPGQIPPGWGGVCLPIRRGARMVGALFVSVPPTRQIAPEQVKLLESLAELAGATLYRLRLLQEAQEQARRVQAVMDTAATGMLLLDGDGRILLANPMAVRALTVLDGAGSGQTLTHLGDRPLAELLAPRTQGGWHEVQAGGRTFEAQARPMTDGDANRSWVLVLNDVTAEREQQRYQQAQERLATVGQMAAGIAHDFNNIMGVIVLYTGMLRKSPGLSERQRGQLDTIRSQAQHAANLIRQILDFSRRSVLQRAPIDLLPLVKELIKLLERTLPENIRLELAYDRSEYVLNGDPTRLQQALMNLALNARDAMPGGGRLTFTCSTLSLPPDQPPPLPDMAAGEWLCLIVADTGTGIAAEHLPHILEPFFTTKEPGKGTGLGLAQVYGIVKQHDGSMDVRSQVGQGSTFTFYLPLHTAAPVQAQMAAAALTGGSECILVVEDNPARRISVTETLTNLGYQVRSAADGVEALAILAEAGAAAVDLLVSDLVMPQMGGIELAQQVRQH
ncbi:MAG: ATP-binding protein, partial [Anaerolineae bacterium]